MEWKNGQKIGNPTQRSGKNGRKDDQTLFLLSLPRVGISSLVILNICSQNQANDVFIAKFGSNPDVKIYQLLIQKRQITWSLLKVKKKHVIQRAIIQTLYAIKGKENM